MEKNDIDTQAWRLEEEACLLRSNLNEIQYGPERFQQIKTRLGMIALEMICRQLENQGHEPGEVMGKMDVQYFGFEAPAKHKSIGAAKVQTHSQA